MCSKIPKAFDSFACEFSKIIEVFLKVIKTHLVFIDFGIFKTVLNLVYVYLASYYFKKLENILGCQITLPKLRNYYSPLSRLKKR